MSTIFDQICNIRLSAINENIAPNDIKTQLDALNTNLQSMTPADREKHINLMTNLKRIGNKFTYEPTSGSALNTPSSGSTNSSTTAPALTAGSTGTTGTEGASTANTQQNASAAQQNIILQQKQQNAIASNNNLAIATGNQSAGYAKG